MNFACDLKLRPPLDNPCRRIKRYREGNFALVNRTIPIEPLNLRVLRLNGERQ